MEEDIPFVFSSLIQLDSISALQDIDTPIEDLEMSLSVDYGPLQINWDGNYSSNPTIISTEQNFYGSGQITLCINDGQFEDCSSMMVNIAPANDPPYFSGEMEAPVGLGLNCNVPVDVDDIDSETLTISLNGDSHPDWLFINNNSLRGIPDVLGQFPVYLNLTDGDTSILDTFQLSVENFVPEITISIRKDFKLRPFNKTSLTASILFWI